MLYQQQSQCEWYYNYQYPAIKMTSFNMFNFNGYDMHTLQHLQDPEAIQDNIGCERIMITDLPDDNSFQCEPLHQGFIQKFTENEQISFQKHYMREHSLVFKREYQKYMEFLRTCDQKVGNKFLKGFTNGLFALETQIPCDELISMAGRELQKSTVAYLKTQLKNHEKLNNFLDIVCDQCPFEIATQLISIAYQVLQDFENSEHKSNKFCLKKDLLAMAQKRSRDLTNLKFLNLSEASQTTRDSEFTQNYNKFMQIYCSTVILNISQFFENPYFENDDNGDLKRTLSPSFSFEDEELQEIYEQCPQKKRKFSF